MKGRIKYTDTSFTASIQCLLYVCVLQTVASVDSMLLQLRHLLHPTKAQASYPDQVAASYSLYANCFSWDVHHRWC